MSETTEVFSVLGLFDSPDALMQAIPKMRERRLGHLEAYTPYPVHGLDRALGQRRSPVGGMVFVMGLLGVATGLLFQWWVSAVDYPIITGGKSPSSWQAFVPIMFEIMVLFAAFTAGLGMLLLLSRLPFFGHPVLRSRAIQGITRDRFALAVEPGREAGESARFDPEAARAALLAVGARDLETLPALERGPFLTAGSIQKSLAGIAVACLVAGVATFGAIKLTPVLSPVSHMLVQPRLDPQMESHFFKDGRGMRPPVPGTVARGFLPPGFHTQDEAAQLPNPLPSTPEVLARGKAEYQIRCAVCHGPLGNGMPTLTGAYGAKPANLMAPNFQAYTDGRIYGAIVLGKNAMPSYAADLPEDARWAVVHYVRALQRAQNAKDEDLK
jgi:mono/diheme cytochrome c family protein